MLKVVTGTCLGMTHILWKAPLQAFHEAGVIGEEGRVIDE